MRIPSTRMAGGELESVIADFERRWADGEDVEIVSFLPAADHPEFPAILEELVRADIEFRWHHGRPRPLEEYVAQFPAIESLGIISSVAFEDYRVRSQHGTPLDREFYSRKYGVDTSEWRQAAAASSKTRTDFGPSRALELPTERVEPGAVIGGFEIVAKLGKGASGAVFIAKQQALSNRAVAIKISPNTSEPEILAQLQHTNIVPIFSVLRTDEYQIFCMPLLGLVTLDEVIERVGGDSLSAPQQLISTIAAQRAPTIANSMVGQRGKDEEGDGGERIAPGVHLQPKLGSMMGGTSLKNWTWLFSRIAEGLQHAHQNGVVHRDLKPENILISDCGEPLILDFHLSTTASGRGKQFIGGTLPYMSPEQLESMRGEDAVDERSDLYSFGVMLYQTLSGRLPFPTRKGAFESVVAAMVEDRRSPPVSLKKIQPGVSHAMSSITARCLHHDPGERYQSATELLTDLHSSLNNRGLVHAPNVSARERIRNWSLRHPRLSSATTIAALSVVLLGLIGFGFWQRGQRLKTFTAVNETRQMIVEMENEIPLLALPAQDFEHDLQNVKQARQLIERWEAESPEQFRSTSRYDRLPSSLREHSLRTIDHLGYWISDAADRLVGRSKSEEATGFLSRLGDTSWGAGAEWETGNFLDRFLTAAEHHRDRRDESAIEILETLSQSHPDKAYVWLLKGNVLAGLGRLDEAEACYTVCIGLVPDPAWAFAQRGVVRLMKKEFIEARDDFSDAIEIDAEVSPYFLNRGLALMGMGDWERAEADFDRAVDLGTAETRVYFLRSRIRRSLGKMGEAKADYELGLKKVPSDERSWISRGVALVRVDPAAAARDFESALALNAESKTALQNLAHVYSERLGDPERGIEYMNRIVENNPIDAEAVATRGVLEARAGQQRVAIESAERAIRLSESAATKYQVAGIYALLSESDDGRADRAIELLREAANLAPQMVWTEIGRDRDLDNLADRAAFKKLRERLGAVFSENSGF